VTPGKVLLADFADDLAALLDHLGIERAVVGGVSMGGQITMEFQLRHPERVRALVLSDTSAPAETAEGKAFRNRLADRLLAEGMDGYAHEVIDKMLAAYNVTAMPDVAARVLKTMCATDPEGAAAALRGRAERPDYRDALASVEAPVLILVGADDVYTPVPEAEAIRRLVPHSTLVVIERAGHLPGAEQPERFNAALLRFLAERL
jgi:pimeloyl-ACP methyl ester carboxylesterase